MKLIFLGTGTSHGVPAIDCMRANYARCPKDVCRKAQNEPKHNRTRCSIVLEYNAKTVLIDVSSDFRQQVLREQIAAIDAVLITHGHADHIGGIPDIRSYTRETALDFYATKQSLERIRGSYDYIFNPPEMQGGGIPAITLHEVEKPFELFGKTVVPLPVVHGSLSGTCGYRIDNLAYIPDLKTMPDSSVALCEGVETLIIDALRDERPHSTHMILPEAIEFSRRLRPKKTYFTHLTHNIHYQLDSDKLDENMDFAWDGMRIEA